MSHSFNTHLPTADYYWWTIEFYGISKVYGRKVTPPTGSPDIYSSDAFPKGCWKHYARLCQANKECSMGYGGCKQGSTCYDKAFIDDKMCNCLPGWEGEDCGTKRTETVYQRMKEARKTPREKYGKTAK